MRIVGEDIVECFEEYHAPAKIDGSGIIIRYLAVLIIFTILLICYLYYLGS